MNVRPDKATLAPLPTQQDRKFSVEEYLAFIDTRPDHERWQLIDGGAMRIPHPTLRHQGIASNLCYILMDHFRARHLPLLPIFRIGLIVPGAALFGPFGDVVVADDDVGKMDTAFVERFHLVAEVLSDGDMENDIPVKLRHYVRHPQNLYVLLIEQDRARVDLRARAAGWAPVILEGHEAVLDLPEWGFRTPLAELYDGTGLGGTEDP
jgi:Uma2 family endonuclease